MPGEISAIACSSSKRSRRINRCFAFPTRDRKSLRDEPTGIHPYSEAFSVLASTNTLVTIGAAGLFMGLLLTGSCALKERSTNSAHRANSIAAPNQEQEAIAKRSRKNYRLSVVPGGVYSAAELDDSRTADRVVAEHYADFGSTVSRRALPADTLMYVSYRVANRVYWSARKHRIPKDEPLLSDGKNMARTRCGNRLSLVPKSPVSREDEPDESMLSLLEPPPSEPSSPLAGIPLPELFAPNMFLAPRDPGSYLLANVAGHKLSLPGLDPFGSRASGFDPGFALSRPGIVAIKSGNSSANTGSTSQGTSSTAGTVFTQAGSPLTSAVPEPANAFLCLGVFGVFLSPAVRRRCGRKPQN